MNTNMLLRSAVALACLFPCSSGAQDFNYTYTDGNGTTKAITNASWAGSPYGCILGTSSTYGIILKKIDFNGNLVFDQGFNILSPGKTLGPNNILHTANDEYIVVGVINSNPFAARFDATGNFLWFREYLCNPGAPAGLSGEEVNICRVQDDPSVAESYILVTSGKDPYASAGSGQDIFTNALRIDGAGNMMWNKKYFPVTGVPPLSLGTNDLRDHAKTIVYTSPSDGSNRYVIAGTADKYISPWTFGGFFMSIDNRGNIVDQYQEIPTSIHGQQSAIFDNTTNEVLLTYLTGNVSAGMAGIPGGPASALAISRIGVSSGGLVLNGNSFYAALNSIENFGTGICEDATRSFYLVSTMINDATINKMNIGLMKIPKSNFATARLSMYNMDREAKGKGIISLQNGAMEHYVIAGTPMLGTSPLTFGMRAIGTDTARSACGAQTQPYRYNTIAYTTKNYTYTSVNITGTAAHGLQTTSLNAAFTDCNDYFPPSAYKLAAGEPKLYPSVLSEGATLWLDWTAAEHTTIEAALYSMDGKLIRSWSLAATPGSNHLELGVPELMPGNYLVKISATEGRMFKKMMLSKP